MTAYRQKAIATCELSARGALNRETHHEQHISYRETASDWCAYAALTIGFRFSHNVRDITDLAGCGRILPDSVALNGCIQGSGADV